MNFKSAAILGAAFGAVLTVSSLAPVEAVAQDRRVRIINDTRHTMVRFYASNSSRTNWEEDILGQRVLPAGNSVVINIDDGDVLTRGQINVCQISEYRYTE